MDKKTAIEHRGPDQETRQMESEEAQCLDRPVRPGFPIQTDRARIGVLYERRNMDPQTAVARLKAWFEDYVNQFASSDARVQENMDLKSAHTRRVCAVILDIGASLNLSIEDLCTAEAAGWLHDIGRFEQYTRYGTFMDHRSEDHAALGVRVIQKTRILERLSAFDPEIIMKVVGAHNRAGLPAGQDDRFLFFLKLVRDADKIDIWRVVTSYYLNSGCLRNHALELDLPDRPHISKSVYEALMKGRLVKMADLKTLNDFKLLQMGWIYDVNFPRTFQIVRDNGYLERIRDALSVMSGRTSEVYRRARSHLDRHCPESEGISAFLEKRKPQWKEK